MKKYFLFVLCFVVFLWIAEFGYHLLLTFFYEPDLNGAVPLDSSIAIGGGEGFAFVVPLVAAIGAYFVAWKGLFRRKTK